MIVFAIGSLLFSLIGTTFFVFDKKASNTWKLWIAKAIIYALLSIAAAIVQATQ